MSSVGYATLSIIPSALGIGKAVADQVAPEMAAAGASAGLALSKGAEKGASSFFDFGKKAAVGFLAAGVASAKLATDYQDSTTKLVTGAGESEDAIGKVRKGLEDMAPAVGIGPDKLAQGMFLVESAGYHGADGLKVMASAAEGARIGGAKASDVANALTTVMKDYGLGADKAADTTSKLVATVAAGKTNMTDLSGSLSAVVPQAAAAGIKLTDLLGAMGTMTGEGISAQQSAQDLASTIGALSNPTAEQTKAMAQMGLNSLDVAKNLGENGLSGTMGTLYQAVMQHMGPAGLVLESSFNQSKLAAASAKTELENLPASLQKLGQGYLDGTVTQKEWQSAIKTQPALVAGLARQFTTTAKEAHGFSDTLKSGGGDAKTFNATMAQMLGGATGLSTSLALTGGHAKDFSGNIKSISGASSEAGGHVKGWAETQKDLGTQLAQAGAAVQVMGVEVGNKLIPVISSALKTGEAWIAGLTKNAPLFYTVAGVIGTVLAVAITAYIGKLVWGAVQSTINFAKMIGETVAWVAKTSVSLAESTALYAMYFAEWLGKTAVSISESVALWAMYAGEWIAKQATALASFAAKNAVALGAWIAETAAKLATSAALWVANAAKTVAAFAIQNAAIVGQKAIMIASAAATGIATAAQWALNVAMEANPIALIIIAITALVAALVWFFTQTKLGQQIWKNVCDFFATAWQSVVDFLSQAWANITAFFSTAIANIVGFVQAHWGLLLSFIIGPVGLAIQWVVEHWGAIVAFFAQVIDNVRRSIVSGFNGVMSWLGGLGKGFLNALGDVGSWLADVGQHVVDGLWNGLRDAWHGMLGMFQGLINLLPAAVKTALGIHSPSLVFRVLGGYTAEGMALGIQDGKEKVQKAADALVPKLPTVQAPTLTPGGIAGQLAAAGGNAPIYVQNPFTGEYLLAKVGQQVDAGINAQSADLNRGYRL